MNQIKAIFTEPLNYHFDKYIHQQERDIAEILDHYEISFIYQRPIYVYDMYNPCIITPSFVMPDYKDLIIDYLPSNSIEDVEFKKDLYNQNNLDAIVFNKQYLAKDNWQKDLYEKINTYE